MTQNALADLVEVLRPGSDRPFGELELISNRTLARFSVAGQEAAQNLLLKAAKALADGDVVRARRLVDRAVRLPYDRFEDAHPAAWEAYMALYTVLVHELEWSVEGDSGWLDAAVAVLESADDPARYALRDTLASIDLAYQLDPSERRTLRSAIAAIPQRTELVDLVLEPDELAEHVLSILAAINQYRSAPQLD